MTASRSLRTAVVGLTRPEDREATAAAARAVAELTHHDPLAGDSCALWSDAVRRAVVGDLTADTMAADGHAALDLTLVPRERRDQWAAWVRQAVETPTPARYSPNGFTVTALQAALAAIVVTAGAAGHGAWLRTGLVAAVGAGDDTDTVAAIAGGLLGALCGASAVPRAWAGAVLGWPGARAPRDLRAADLVRLAGLTARSGMPAADGPGGDAAGWRGARPRRAGPARAHR